MRYIQNPHQNSVYICMQNCTRCIQHYVYKIYTRCIQNAFHISTNFGIHFVYKIKRTMIAKLCIQNVYIIISVYLKCTS